MEAAYSYVCTPETLVIIYKQSCGVGVGVVESESESEGILGGVGVGRNF
jgi:hypothetical protein